MKKIFFAAILLSIPVIMMTRVLQAYRYAVALEEMENYEQLIKDRLESNKRLLAGIAVFSAPERVYKIGKIDLGLIPADAENVAQVELPEKQGSGD
ncbi:MAG: hypothetical protein B0D92_05885 [Spirochaeta sp. LUC14_002_19_P3]|nr:MAG: hypothetical protein B0D92_05885 [Spirochaeta sp. LUC14_002_19_P3]